MEGLQHTQQCNHKGIELLHEGQFEEARRAFSTAIRSLRVALVDGHNHQQRQVSQQSGTLTLGLDGHHDDDQTINNATWALPHQASPDHDEQCPASGDMQSDSTLFSSIQLSPSRMLLLNNDDGAVGVQRYDTPAPWSSSTRLGHMEMCNTAMVFMPPPPAAPSKTSMFATASSNATLEEDGMEALTISATLVYNLALTLHKKGMAHRCFQSLRRAVRIYQRALAMSSDCSRTFLFPEQQGNNPFAPSNLQTAATLVSFNLFLSSIICNNIAQAHLLIDKGRGEVATFYFDELHFLLLHSERQQGNNDEDKVLWLNVVSWKAMEQSCAPAA